MSWGIVVTVTAGLGACDAPKVHSPEREDAGANIAMCVDLETALEHTASCKKKPTAHEIERAFDECADVAAHVNLVCLPALSRWYACSARAALWCPPGELDCSQARHEWEECRAAVEPDSGTSGSDGSVTPLDGSAEAATEVDAR